MTDVYTHCNTSKAVDGTEEEKYSGIDFSYIRLFVATINQAIEDLDSLEPLYQRQANMWLFEPSREDFSLHYMLKHIGMLHRIDYVRDLARKRVELKYY